MNRLPILALLMVGVFPARPSAADCAPAEQDWARGIVKDFFHSAFDHDGAGVGLFSPELAKSHAWMFARGQLVCCNAFHIVSEEVSPHGSEVIFKGNVKGGFVQDRYSVSFHGTFALRVAKESGGRWSIRYVRLNWLN